MAALATNKTSEAFADFDILLFLGNVKKSAVYILPYFLLISTKLDWRYFFGIVTMNHAFLLNDLCSRDH